MKPQLVCGGGCCNNCNIDKTHKDTAQLTEPTINDDGLDLIKGCDTNKEETKSVTTSPTFGPSIDGLKLMLHTCKDGKHILKKGQRMSTFRRCVSMPFKIKIYHLLMITSIIMLTLFI